MKTIYTYYVVHEPVRGDSRLDNVRNQVTAFNLKSYSAMFHCGVPRRRSYTLDSVSITTANMERNRSLVYIHT